MPVWFENEAPNTSSRSDSFISQLATGVPLRPSTPAPSGWRSDTWPLALNVVSTGASSASASASTSSMSKRAPCPTTMIGRFARPMSVEARRRARLRAERCVVGHAADGRRRGASPARCLQLLHLVGQHEMRHVAADDCVLECEGHQLAVVRRRQHRLRVARDVGERRSEVDVLERAAARAPSTAPAPRWRAPARGRPWRRRDP